MNWENPKQETKIKLINKFHIGSDHKMANYSIKFDFKIEGKVILKKKT